jgi:hypothetical protein
MPKLEPAQLGVSLGCEHCPVERGHPSRTDVHLIQRRTPRLDRRLAPGQSAEPVTINKGNRLIVARERHVVGGGDQADLGAMGGEAVDSGIRFHYFVGESHATNHDRHAMAVCGHR